MKFLLVLACAGLAMAEPEADAAFAYSVGHLPLVYPYAAVHAPLPYALHAVGCTNDAGVAVPCAVGGLLPYGHVAVAAPAAADEEAPAVEEARKKREAEADPAVLYSSTVVKNPSPYLIHNAPVHQVYSPYAHYLPYGGLIYGRKKREAEAEAEADADAWYGYAYGYPYAYSHAFYTPYLHHGHGCTNYLGALVPCAGRR